MSTSTAYKGSCFCGAVQFTVTGKPAMQGYCHCESCRTWAAAPANAFTLWDPKSVSVTQGSDNIATFNKTANSERCWCKVCGGHLFSRHPTMELTDVYAAVIPDFPFKPGMHVHYQEATLHIYDGLPKMRDLPEEAGGSGELIAE